MIKSILKTLPKMETIITETIRGIDLVIIGGGPAGLTAGIYAIRMGLNTVLIERAMPGGVMGITDRIENYPGFPEGIKGMDLSKAFEAHARELGLQTRFGTVKSIDCNNKAKKVNFDDKSIETKAIIIASGTEPKKLGISGEKEFVGRGVSYCATCDAPFYKDKKIAVIGGGNSAIEEAIFLSTFASSVTIIHRRNKLRADKSLELKAKANPKIYFIWDSVPVKIEGKDKVERVAIKNVKTEKTTSVSVDGIFFYVGSNPNTSFLEDKLKTDGQGFIITDEDMKTSVEGVFAAGDIRKKSLRQIVTSAADGAIAAFSAHKFIESQK